MKNKNSEKVKRTSSSAMWPVRAEYAIGKTRRHRKKQYDQQMQMLMMVIVATVVIGALVVLLNWREAGGTKAADCLNYPQYCVPFAGGSAINDDLEAVDARDLEASSEGVEGVVRYIDTGNIPTLGDPGAPIHFRTVSNFTCSHCNTFHTGDMETFIEEYVLTGHATFGIVMVTGGNPETNIATQGAMCAGEQGAYWEMTDELYRITRNEGYRFVDAENSLRNSADKMGLDKDAISNCVADGRYFDLMYENELFGADNGVAGTPTVLVSYGDSGEWQQVNRSYSNLAQLAEIANQ